MQHTQPDCSFDSTQLLDELDQQGFSIIHQVHPTQLWSEILQECLVNLDQFRQAAIQDGVISQIRSDHILWIDQNLKITQQHMQQLDALAAILNQNFYLGVQNIEAHFASYDAGQFYALHRDNPQQKNDRRISAVYYLHPEWNDTAGGQLRLQDKQGTWHTITPTPNSMVVFQSDLLHEVLPALQQRLSITAWLRSGHSLWT